MGTALVERDLGRIDVAERLAASSVRHWAATGNREQCLKPVDVDVREGRTFPVIE